MSYALDHSVPEEMALAPEVYAGRAHSRSFPWLYEHMDRPVSLQDGACRRRANSTGLELMGWWTGKAETGWASMRFAGLLQLQPPAGLWQPGGTQAQSDCKQSVAVQPVQWPKYVHAYALGEDFCIRQDMKPSWRATSFHVRLSWDPTSASEAAAAAGRDHQLERPFVEKGALPLSRRKNGCAEECNKGSVGTSIMTALVSVWIHPHV